MAAAAHQAEGRRPSTLAPVSTLVRLALRNLLRHPWRSVATTLGIGLGIAAVLTTLSVGANVEANLRSALQAAAGKADLVVTPGAGGRAVFEAEPLLSEVRADPGVAAALPVLQTRAEPARGERTVEKSVIPGVDSGFQIQGRLTRFEDDLPAKLAEGSLPAAGSRGIAIADGFARSRAIAVGDTVEFTTATGKVPLLVTGLLDDGVGIASTNGGRVGVMALADLQDVLALTGRVSNVEVVVRDVDDVQAVAARLRTTVGDGFTVTLPAGSGDFTFGIVQTLQSGLSVLAATLLALGAFLAYNTFMASVVERSREYALLRTVCMTRGGTMRLAFYEALALAAFGVLSGVLLGVVLSYVVTYLNAVTLGYEFRTLVLPVRNVLLASALGVAAALVAGIIPARNAGRTSPIASLQANALPPRRRHAVIGLALVVAGTALALVPWPGLSALYATTVALGMFFLGVALTAPYVLPPVTAALRSPLTRVFGAPGKLGASFAARNAARNGVAIGTVVVGTGLVIGVGSMVSSTNHAISSWVETTVVGDLFVTAPVTFPDDFAARAQAVPGVDVASGVKITAVRFLQPGGDTRGRAVALVLVDPARFDPDGGFGRFQYLPGQGDDRTGYDTLRSGEVLVANTMRDRYGFQKGDQIELRTSDGFAPFRVGGVVVDFTGGGEAVVGSIDQIARFGGGNPDLFVVVVSPGESQTAVKERLLAAFPELALDITQNADYKRYILDVTSQAFATTRVLLLIAVIVAALGVANTLGMNLASRGHEIAVLRTIGLTRRGVRTLVTAEGIIVTTVGALIGVGFGLLLARIITNGAGALTGFVLAPRVPWALALLALAASPVIGLVAALLPARRAARMAPTRALASWSEHV